MANRSVNKVILIGNPWLYQLLYLYDEDFHKFFKIKADFDWEMKRTPEHQDQLLLADIDAHDDIVPGELFQDRFELNMLDIDAAIGSASHGDDLLYLAGGLRAALEAPF